MSEYMPHQRRAADWGTQIPFSHEAYAERARRMQEQMASRDEVLGDIRSNRDAYRQSIIALNRTRQLALIPAFPQYGPNGQIDLPGINDHPIMQDPAAREWAGPIIEARFNRRRMGGFWRQIPRRYRDRVPYDHVARQEVRMEPTHGQTRRGYNKNIGLYTATYDRNRHEWVTEVRQTAEEVRAHGEAWSMAYEMSRAMRREQDRVAINNFHNYLSNPFRFERERGMGRTLSALYGQPYEYDSGSTLTLPETWEKIRNTPTAVAAVTTTETDTEPERTAPAPQEERQRAPEKAPEQVSLLDFKELLFMPKERRDILLPTMEADIKTALLNDLKRAGLDERVIAGKETDLEILQDLSGTHVFLIDRRARKTIADVLLDYKGALRVTISREYNTPPPSPRGSDVRYV